MVEPNESQECLMERIANNSKQLADIIKEDPVLLQKARSMNKGVMLEVFLIHIAKKNGLRGKHISSKLVLDNLK